MLRAFYEFWLAPLFSERSRGGLDNFTLNEEILEVVGNRSTVAIKLDIVAVSSTCLRKMYHVIQRMLRNSHDSGLRGLSSKQVVNVLTYSLNNREWIFT